MKQQPKQNVRRLLGALNLKLTCLAVSGILLLGSVAQAEEIFNTDFSSGEIEALGWESEGQPWQIFDYATVKAAVQNNPGKLARFPGRGSDIGDLIKSFPALANPQSLQLTYEAGWGWGPENAGDSLLVMLLDDKGNGYVFDVHRTAATWALQWGKVTEGAYKSPLNWAKDKIDGKQKAILDGGGLLKFTVTRDANGNFELSCDKWASGKLAFSDTTTSTFSKVVVRGAPNVNDMAFKSVKLEATK